MRPNPNLQFINLKTGKVVTGKVSELTRRSTSPDTTRDATGPSRRRPRPAGAMPPTPARRSDRQARPARAAGPATPPQAAGGGAPGPPRADRVARPGPRTHPDRRTPPGPPNRRRRPGPAPPDPARQPGPQARHHPARDRLRADPVRRAPGPAAGDSRRPYRRWPLNQRDDTIDAARAARQHHRRERRGAGHDRGHLPGLRRPAADPAPRSSAQVADQAGRATGPARGDRSSATHPAPRPRRSTWCWPRACPRRRATRSTALNLPGISLTPSYARSYPDGDSTANIVGFTGTNARGRPDRRGRASSRSTTRCWPGRRAASRCRSARTASRSRSRAATTSRWSTAATCA